MQSPGGARDELAKKLGLPPENVTVQRDAARRRFRPQVEMGLRASKRRCCRKAMDGAPVKVIWTREDDIQHDYYHTVSAERIEAGLDADRQGRRLAAPQRRRRRSVANFMPDPKYPSSRSSSGWGSSTCRSTSRTSAARTARPQAHTRIGWFRSVSNIPHAFADSVLRGRDCRTQPAAIRRTCCSS